VHPNVGTRLHGSTYQETIFISILLYYVALFWCAYLVSVYRGNNIALNDAYICLWEIWNEGVVCFKIHISGETVWTLRIS
jgi:hypothetical protein